jgi:hypothetical protein
MAEFLYFQQANARSESSANPSSAKGSVTDKTRNHSLSWSPDGGTKLAAAYLDPFWKNLFDHKENDSFIWNIGIDICRYENDMSLYSAV